MKHSQLLVPITFLIIYGSLYPFNFSPAKPDALWQLLSNRALLTSMGDMLGNVALFAPLGLSVMLSGVPRWGLSQAALSAMAIGLILSLGLQVLQIFLPTRDAALADVAWNMLGTLCGTVAGGYIAKQKPGLAVLSPAKAMPIFFLAGLIAIEWIPIVPSLDMQLVKAHVTSLWTAPVTVSAPLWQGIAVTMLAAYLMTNVLRLRQPTLWLVLFLAVVSFGKLFMEDMPMQPSAPLGLALGALGWWISKQISEVERHTLVWVALIVCYTASALHPYQLRDEAAAVSWLPFATMLEGSMLQNVRSLAGNLTFYVGILYVGGLTAGRLASATLGLALWVLVVKLMQSLIKSRGADITEPLLVLFVGHALAMLQRFEASKSSSTASAVLLDHPRPNGELTTWFLQAGAATVVLMLGTTTLLSLPGIPYNVRELFRADASLPALFAFSVALLWVGGGSAWLGTRLARAQWPAFQLLPLTLLVSTISLACLWAGVTTESIEDISGSANRFWFVTQQEIWGAAWKEAFLSIGSSQPIDAVEHLVRYSALYAPLPVVLAVLLVLRQLPHQRKKDIRGLTGLLLGAMALLWLCKAIAFDWTSTDNLNELIARDGEWGWGGGGFLYALLLIICINAMLMAEVASGDMQQFGLALLINLAALPFGWWLLNQGLEQSVKKYEVVYSGTQFLLGEDRVHRLSQDILFVRWCAVQATTTCILATGIWLGQSASRMNLTPGLARHRAPATQENTTA